MITEAMAFGHGTYPARQVYVLTEAMLGLPSTRALRDKYSEPAKHPQITAMNAITGGRLAPFPGGVLCTLPDGQTIVGAIGVSGASADEDEMCAFSGARAAGFETSARCVSYKKGADHQAV
eukprot:g68669.t1